LLSCSQKRTNQLRQVSRAAPISLINPRSTANHPVYVANPESAVGIVSGWFHISAHLGLASLVAIAFSCSRSCSWNKHEGDAKVKSTARIVQLITGFRITIAR
jgi:hypothetical protein